ncbi:sterol-4-alpha-carboxylate 3-dehydrogenase [Acrasis kona]|uniref:Sterol-4-alpha-carboxylate 3-dehydrogenase n=1 Tax=Acrasis kona TaxID=1008807 RepID=A0AAW2ZMV3_9EUKA
MAHQERCLVIGGNGFLGRHIVEDLIAKGKKVAVFDINKSAAYDEVKVLKDNVKSFYKGSINNKEVRNVVGVDDFMVEFQVSVVYHTASPSAFAPADILKLVNIDGTKTLLEACREVESVKVFVLISSASVVYEGKDVNNVDETAPYALKGYNPYTDTKIEQEKIVLRENKKAQFMTVSIRPASIFGEWDPLLLPQVAQHRPKFFVGTGLNKMDFTYAKNISHACMLAVDNIENVNGEAFFITNDDAVSFWGFLGDMLTDIGYERPYIRVPASIIYVVGLIVWFFCFVLNTLSFGNLNLQVPTPISSDKLAYFTTERRFSCNKAKKRIGYKPLYNMEQARRRTTEWYKNEFMDKKNK